VGVPGHFRRPKPLATGGRGGLDGFRRVAFPFAAFAAAEAGAGWYTADAAPRRTTPPGNAEQSNDPAHRLSTEEIIAIVEELGDIVNALRDAEPEHKLDVYRNLGLRLTYDPETRTVLADIDLATHRRDLARVRRSTQTNTPLVPILDLDLTLA
jgi:hypothetical protein